MSDQYDAPNPEPGSATAVAPAPAYAPPNPEPKVPNQPQLPVGDVPTAYSAPNPEQARQNVMALSPDPAQADAKIQASKFLADWMRLNPGDVHGNFDAVAKAVYGDSVKGQPPTTILQKVQGLFGAQAIADINHGLTTLKNIIIHPGVGGFEALKEVTSGINPENIKGTIGSWQAQDEIGALGTRQMSTVIATGKEDDATAQKIADLQKVGSPAQHLGFVPEQLLRPLYSLGYQGLAAGEVVADSIASALTLEPIRKSIARSMGRTTLTDFGGMANDAAERFTGQMSGAAYVGMRDKGIPPDIAAPAAVGTGLLLAAVQSAKIHSFPGMGGAKETAINTELRGAVGALETTGAKIENTALIEDLARQAAVKAQASSALKGTLGATVSRIAQQGKVQGALGVLTAVTNDAGLEFATAINNATREGKLPYESAQKILTDVLGAGLQGEGMGVTMGALGEVYRGAGRGGTLDEVVRQKAEEIDTTRLSTESQEARFEEAVKASVEKAKAAEVPEHPIEAATREMQAKQTIGDIMDREPQLPEVKPAEDPYAAKLEADTAKKTTEDHPYAAIQDEYEKSGMEAKAIVARKLEKLTKLGLPLETAADSISGQLSQVEGFTPRDVVEVLQDIKNRIVEPLEAKATERPSTGNGSETTTEPATRPVTPAMSEEQGRVLDKATMSSEGTEDYIERRPDVQALNKKISDLQLAVDQGKTDAKAALEAAKADKVAAVKSLREQIKTRAQTNKDLADIKAVVAGAKYMNRDLGDAVKALGEKLDLKGKTSKANLTEDYLSELSAVHDALKAEPDRGPTIDLGKLKDLSRVKARDLSPEDLADVTDALKNLAWVQRMRDKVRTTQGDIERSALRTDTLPRIKGMKLTAEEMANKEPTLGKTFKAAVRDAKSEGAVLANTYDMNAEIVFGGQDNDAYRTVGRDMLEASYALEPAQNALKSPIMDDHLKSLGIDYRTNPEEYNAMRGRRITEDNVTATYGEIMSWYMMFKDANHKESLLNGTRLEHWDAIDTHDIIKIPEETFLKMFSNLDPKDVKMMDEVATKQLLKSGDALAKDFEERYGYPMPRVENRWPKFVIKGEKANFATDLEDLQKSKQWIRLHVDESRTKERTRSTAPVYTRDFYSTIQEDLNQSALITTMAKRAKAAADILWDPVIGPKLERQFGKPRINMMRDDLKYMAGQKDTPRGFENAMDTAGNWTGIIDLAGNIKSGVKQAALALRSPIQFGSMESFMKTLADVTFHRNGSRETSRATSKLYDSQTRRGGTLDQTQMLRKELAISSPGAQGGHPVLERAARVVSRARTIGKRAGMAFNRAGTDFAYNFDATLGRKQAEIEFRRASQGKQMHDDFKNATGLTEGQVAGLSPADKMIAAGKYSDSIIGQTHASNIRGQEAGIQKFPVMRFLTKFKGEGIKGFEVVRRTIMQAHRNPTAQNIWKATRVTAFYAIGEGLMFYGMDQAGTAITNAIRGLVGKEPLPEPKRNRKEMLGDVAKSIGRADAGMVLGLGDMAVEGYNLAVNPQQPNMGPVEQTLAMAPQSFAAVLKMINPHSNQVEKDKAWKQLLSSLTDTGLTTFGLSQRPLRGLLK